MSLEKTSPIEVKPCTKEDDEKLKKYFSGLSCDHIRVGPSGYLLLDTYEKEVNKVHQMPLYTTDIFVDTFPRSGTTWTQDLVWLIVNNLDFEKAKSIPLTDRYVFLEFFMFIRGIENGMRADFNNEEQLRILEHYLAPGTEVLAKTPSPRFIKSHLPLSLLPAKTLETAKVVYVARDPRDVAVSYYHFMKVHKQYGLTVENFKEYYYDMFVKDLVFWSPFFAHVKEAWALRDHPNLLFLFYEDLSKDLKNTTKRVAEFFGKQYTEEQFDQLCNHLSFSNFQKNTSVELVDLQKIGFIEKGDANFVRKGKSGGWREYFDEEMTRHAERWIEDNLRDTDLRFPQ